METMRLLLSPSKGRIVTIHVIDSPVGQTKSPLEIDFGELIDRRSALLKSLEATAFDSKQFSSDELDWMGRSGWLNDAKDDFHDELHQKIGCMLYQKLFGKDTEVRDLFRSSLAVVIRTNELLHLQLQIGSEIGQSVRIADFPWELLRDESDFLAKNKVSLSRYIAHGIPPPRLPRNEKVNVLLVSSRAYDLKNGLKEIHPDEYDQIRNRLESNDVQKERFRLEILEPVTFARFREFLATHHGNHIPHIIHFDGHGFFGKQCKKCPGEIHSMSDSTCRSCGKSNFLTPQGYLLFEHQSNRVEYVSAEDVAGEIENANLNRKSSMQDHIALIVLSACRTSVSLFNDTVFNGVAQSLIRAGIPTVVAMQFSVTISSAVSFAQRFYLSLGEKNPLVMVMNDGRMEMGYSKDQWYRPVLYQRWQDDQGGQLFADAEAASGAKGERPPDIRDFGPGTEDSHGFFEAVSLLCKPITENLQESEEQKGKYILPKAHRAFFGSGIGPISCKRARDELRELKHSIYLLIEFVDSDNANILHLSIREVQLRDSISQPIYDSRAILHRLEPLIEKFIPLSEDSSRDMRRSLQEIRESLRELEKYLNIIKNTIDNS